MEDPHQETCTRAVASLNIEREAAMMATCVKVVLKEDNQEVAINILASSHSAALKAATETGTIKIQGRAAKTREEEETSPEAHHGEEGEPTTEEEVVEMKTVANHIITTTTPAAVKIDLSEAEEREVEEVVAVEVISRVDLTLIETWFVDQETREVATESKRSLLLLKSTEE